MKNRFAILALLLLFSACTSGYKSVPLPHAQAKLTITPSTYTNFMDSLCANFSFEIAEEVQVSHPQQGGNCDLNLLYPSHNATLHLSYVETVPDSVYKWKEVAREMVYEHVDKSSGIEENSFINKNGLNTIMYHIVGDAATNVQFVITDDSTKLLRGALYFFASPNYDSIKPVLNKIEDDSEHMLQTFEFK